MNIYTRLYLFPSTPCPSKGHGSSLSSSPDEIPDHHQSIYLALHASAGVGQVQAPVQTQCRRPRGAPREVERGPWSRSCRRALERGRARRTWFVFCGGPLICSEGKRHVRGVPPPAPWIQPVRRMRWRPEAVSTMPLSWPTSSSMTASSNSCCMYPAANQPRSPPCSAVSQSEWTRASSPISCVPA